MGLWITQLPPIVRAEERVQRLKVPGRAGHLTMTEGENIYDGYVKNCVVTVRGNADFDSLTKWLRGEGKVVFSNEENRLYTARIAGNISFDKLGNLLRQATIPFYVQPYKERYPKELPITKNTQSFTIYNPGDVESRPTVIIDHTGDIEIEIGGIIMTFNELDSPVIVNCDAELVTDQEGNIWQGTYSGEFWRIPAGNSTVNVSEQGVTLQIVPEWRWV